MMLCELDHRYSKFEWTWFFDSNNVLTFSIIYSYFYKFSQTNYSFAIILAFFDENYNVFKFASLCKQYSVASLKIMFSNLHNSVNNSVALASRTVAGNHVFIFAWFCKYSVANLFIVASWKIMFFKVEKFCQQFSSLDQNGKTALNLIDCP